MTRLQSMATAAQHSDREKIAAPMLVLGDSIRSSSISHSFRDLVVFGTFRTGSDLRYVSQVRAQRPAVTLRLLFFNFAPLFHA